MLVLSRRIGEKVLIGDNIVVTIVDYANGKVRVGIQCPKDIPIFREELLPIKPAGVPPASPA